MCRSRRSRRLRRGRPADGSIRSTTCRRQARPGLRGVGRVKPPPMQVEPVTLTGSIVRLEPLTMCHLAHLSEAAQHEQIWTYLDEPTPESDQPMAALIEEALAEQA